MELVKDINGRAYLQSTKKEREEDEIRMGLKGFYKVEVPISDKYMSYYWEKKPGTEDNKKDSDLPF